jgi:hypothetical protein
MVTLGQLWTKWYNNSEWGRVIIGLIFVLIVTIGGYAAKAWADENYVPREALEAAVQTRDLKDINSQLDDLELEIQQTNIWLRFLPQDEVAMRQIYGAQLDVLVQAKAKATRKRQEALRSMGATIESQ